MAQADQTRIFTNIYVNGSWRFGSGHGSLPSVTRSYRRYLQRFIDQPDVRHVVDLGCGDWQFSRYIDWSSVDYLGLEVVPELIESNTTAYGASNVRFARSPARFADLPPADLLIAKDVLQHWPSRDISDFLTIAVEQYRYCLITNCVRPKRDRNSDIPMGAFRPLDIREPPFNAPATRVHRFFGPVTVSLSPLRVYPAWEKQVLLLQGRTGT